MHQGARRERDLAAHRRRPPRSRRCGSSTIIPEFGTNGKDVVTVEQLLLHTSGFPRAPLGPPEWYTREGRLARFERWRLNFEPGTKFEYHPTAAHWVLAEVIERIAGSDYRDFIRTRHPRTARADNGSCSVVPSTSRATSRRSPVVGEAATPDELEAAIGVRELPLTEVTEEVLLGFNAPENLALGVPGGGAVSTAADLALFYQALLDDPGGVWAPEVRLDGISEVRNRFPDERGVPANRTLGLVVAGDDGQSALRGMGYTVSPRPSVTTAPAVRSRGPIPRPVCRSCISPTGSTGTCCAKRGARRGSRAGPRAASTTPAS